jgi:hypothetical protein
VATPLLEPMTVGGILDRTFRLYRENVLRYAAIAAVIQVPLGLLAFASMAALTSAATIRPGDAGASGASVALALGGFVAVMALLLLSLVGQELANAALLKSISASYLGEDVTVGQAYRFILPRFGWVLLAALLVGILKTVGFAFCVVPGVFVSLFLFLTIPALVAENLNAFDGMRRSWSLVSGNLGKVFLVGLVILLINLVLYALFAAAGALTARYLLAENQLASAVVQQALGLILGLIMMPIWAAAAALLYYDLRIRKEGFDLEMLAHSLGEGGATDAPGA